MPREGQVHTDSDIGPLAKELPKLARRDWREWKRFRFEDTPVLARLLRLENNEESVNALRDLLLQIKKRQEQEEVETPPLHNRSLAEAWTALLTLDEDWYGANLDVRRQYLVSKWRKKDGGKIKSTNGFTLHQEPYIYGELATCIVASASSGLASNGASSQPPKDDQEPSKRSEARSSPWPVPEYEPAPDQEIVILIAAQAMRTGPSSGLMKLVREFEPYWRATGTMVYALEGSFKEIWRAGLLHGYKHFAPLTAGFYGGLVHAAEVVIAAAEASPKRRTHVVYLIDPHDTSSIYPATASLKRECLLTQTAFLTSYHGAARWFRLEWARRVTDGDSPARDLLVAPPDDGFPSELEDREEVLALAAHDRHKRAMMDFADRHVELIDRRFPERWATQVTGYVLNGGSILDEEYRDDILSDVGDRQREELKKVIEAKTSEWLKQERSKGPGSDGWIPELTKGRRGGVIQLASKVLKDECDTVLFFQDGETPREHDTEIQVLDRAAQLADSNCLLLHDKRSADRWAENLEVCLGDDGTSTATSLVEAFHRVFKVELVLAHPIESKKRGWQRPRQQDDDSTASWARITATAGIYIVSALRTAAAERAEQSEPVRLGFAWGGATRDILGRVEGSGQGRAVDTRALAGGLGLHEFVDKHEADDLRHLRSSAISDQNWLPLPKQGEPYGPTELRVVPTVGVIGAQDRSLESHSLAERAVQILGGETVPYPASAFAITNGQKDPWGGAPQHDWENLDVLLLTAAPLLDRSEQDLRSLATGLPADLAQDYSKCEGAVGTIYLEEKDGEIKEPKHHAYWQVGMSMEEIRKLKAARRKVVLVNGAQEGPRRRAAWAALKAGLATTFITDQAFAWGVLQEEIPNLKPPASKANGNPRS